MPLYEFECQECNENFEKLMRLAGTHEAVCPKCGSTKTQKKISTFSTNASGSSLTSFGGASNCAPGGT